ncbi:MAG: endonuclease domain-containing protein [Kiloniellaceae bacterium]
MAGKSIARSLRRNATDAEHLLWQRLRNRQIADLKFRRQEPIGPFVVDFFCLERNLIVEVDGGQHATAQDRDAARTAWLEARGYRVIRFWNNEVIGNIEGVLETIARAVRETKSPSP